MGRLFVVISLTILSGCGTLHTVANAKNGVFIKDSYCEEINHVMSGVSYNWCQLHGEPREEGGFFTERSFERIASDASFSFVTDIVVLPYTIFKQCTAEPIKVYSSKR